MLTIPTLSRIAYHASSCRGFCLRYFRHRASIRQSFLAKSVFSASLSSSNVSPRFDEVGHESCGSPAKQSQVIDQAILRNPAGDDGAKDKEITAFANPFDSVLRFTPVNSRLHRRVRESQISIERSLNLPNRSSPQVQRVSIICICSFVSFGIAILPMLSQSWKK